MPSPGSPDHRTYRRTRPPSPDALDRDGAAEFLGISRRTLTRWTADGRLSSFMFAGTRWYPRGALQRYMDTCRTGVQRF